jgi:uncharacterized membrane protein YdjX (TVP38/TMEM64 family)
MDPTAPRDERPKAREVLRGEAAPPDARPPRPRLDLHVVASALLALAWFTLPLGFSVLLLANLGPVTEWFESHGGTGVVLAAVVFAVASGLGLLPTYAQSIVVGWVFGMAVGLPVAVLGYVGGAILGLGVSKVAAGRSVQALVDARPKWAVVRRALVESGTWRTIGIVALVRFPPNSPFAFTNLVLAASGVGWVPMMVGSLAGMLPRTAVAVAVAAQGRATGARSLAELVEKQGLLAVSIGVALLIVVLFVMQRIGVRALRMAGLEGT